MLKRLCLALAGLFALVSVAQGAGTVPGFSLTPQFDLSGAAAPGCKLYIYQAGTVATPQNAYSDSGLTQVLPNPMTCDAGARLGEFFVADGLIKLRLTKANGTQIFVGDNLTVVGASSGGGGGGGTVDPTTISATGDMKAAYGTSVLSGWVRANGRTIGSATSGATERANSDCQALFVYLWSADSNLSVSGGRGASAAADWSANKTIALPDARGRVVAGLDDMGASAAGRLTSSYFGSTATTLGATGGSESKALATANLPPYTPAGTIVANISTLFLSMRSASASGSNVLDSVSAGNTGGTSVGIQQQSSPSGTVTSTFTGTAQGGTSSSFAITQPTMLVTYYLKL